MFCHASRQFAKKIRGKLHYFGTWDDPQAALDRWLAEKDYLLAGKKPRTAAPSQLTVRRLCNLFLESRERKVATGELTQRTFDDYFAIAKTVTKELGSSSAVDLLAPEDFVELRAKLAQGLNLKTLEGRIACVRAIFNYGDKNGLLERPLSKIWGVEFAKPSKSALSKLKNQTVRLFTANEIWRLLDAASVPVQAMIWLGINCGFGNTDVGKLKTSNLDLAAGWLNMPRSKTGINRRVPLWRETIAAIKRYLAVRPIPSDEKDSDLVFITKHKANWIPTTKDNPLSKEFSKARKTAKITGPGKSFYTLRHCFQTIGDETRDFVAVSSIMGHAASSISDHYREKIDDDRLQTVVKHVRKWMVAGKPKAGKSKKQNPVKKN